MKRTELNDKDFVLSDCTREEAAKHIPNQDYAIMTVYEDTKATDPLKRYAYAIFYAPNYIPDFCKRDHEIISNHLQRLYDEARGF